MMASAKETMETEPLLSRPKGYTWEELETIEDRRLKTLTRAELPYWKILHQLEGTCLHAISTDWLLWVTLGLFGAIRFFAWRDSELPEFAKDFGTMNIDIIGGFLSFFLVLFVNQSNIRFQNMYTESMNAIKRINDVAATVATAFPKARAHRIVRYMNAAHTAGYVGLNETYTRDNCFLRINESYALLTSMEWKTIISKHDIDHGPEGFHELAEWALNDVHLAFNSGIIEAKDFIGLRDKILAFRGSMDTLYEYHDQPIHFFYIHFLCLLIALYMPLFAISNAYKAGVGEEMHWSLDALAGMIVLLQSIFVIGLRMLGRKLVDPYGDDLEDLSVLRYIRNAWTRSNRLLVTSFPGEVSEEVENTLERKQVPLQSSLT